jgi:photosystem II stability/assembly factor-like uncharacterized protein
MKSGKYLFLQRFVILALVLTAGIISKPSSATGFTYRWGHPSPQGNSVYGIAFKDSSTGWAVTGCGSIMQTADGGESWELIYGPDSLCSDLYDILVTEQGTLIASGNQGRILRSSDEGGSWEESAFPAAGRLYDLAPFPGGGISTAGENGVVMVSFDDGVTWTDKGPGGSGYARHHTWKSASEGYVGGFGIFHRTTDGGNTWVQIGVPSQFGINEIYFVNDNVGYAVEDFGFWKTLDGGESWTHEDVFSGILYRFRTLALDELHWFAVTFVEGSELWETTDGGENWEMLSSYYSTGFLCLVKNGERMLFGGDIGDIFYTDDEGVTILDAVENLAVFPSAPITIISKRPDGILFANNQPNTGIDNGTFFRSDNDGASWYVPDPSPGLRWVSDIQFFDNQYGILGSYGDIRYTADGGESWNAGSLPEGYNLTNFALPAADRFFVGTYASYPGSGGNLYKSADQGETWQVVGGGLPVNQLYISHVSFASANVGYLACQANSQQQIYKSTDGGATWSLMDPSVSPGFISDMAWLDENTGIAAVPNGETSGIYRTIDGGNNWTKVSEVSARSLSLGPDHNIAATDSYDTFFQESVDDGLSWVNYTPPFNSSVAGNPGYVYSVQTTENGYIIGGAGNRLMVAERDAATGIDDDGASPAESQEGQNITVFPNPVNDMAVVRINLEEGSLVSLALFDMQGRLVKTLKQQYLQKGVHEFPLKAGELRQTLGGGIYFVTLQTVESFDSVKMILAE